MYSKIVEVRVSRDGRINKYTIKTSIGLIAELNAEVYGHLV